LPDKDIVMKSTKRLLVALAIALTGASCFAVEAEQWNPPGGDRARAAVVSQLRAAQASGEMNNRNETYGTVVIPARVTRARTEVQAEGSRAMHEHKLNELYVGG